MGGSGISGSPDEVRYFLSDFPPELTDSKLIDTGEHKSFLDDLVGFDED